MDNYLFQANGVSYSFDGRGLALQGVNLSISPGEKVAILGPNGSGKSTLLALLDGLCFPTEGELLAFGRPLTEAAFSDEEFALSFRRRVGLVFQDPDTQLFCSTVWDEIAFGPLQLGLPPAQLRERVDAAMELLHISSLRDRPPYRLSGGEKKKVAIASVLAIEPEVLLLDEPTAGLDPRTQCQLLDFLFQWQENGKTIITATHDLDIVEEIAQRVVVLAEDGTVAAEGGATELLGNREFLQRTNLIHYHVHRHGPLAHSHLHGPLEHHEHRH